MPFRSGRRSLGVASDPEHLDDLPVAVLVLEGGKVALVNGEWTELTGRSLEESIGDRWLEALHEGDREAARTLALRPNERDVEGHDWRLRNGPGGAELWIHARVRHLPTVATGRCVITITEIDDRKTNELRLLHLATHDPGTGLPNRQLFERRLHEALMGVDASSVTAVLFIDLDRFKEVNDQLGHRFGDLLLTAVAGRIEGTIRPSDLVARLGGDEFGVVCTGLDDATEATALADRLVDVLGASFVLDGHVVEMSASVGVSWSGGSDGGAGPLGPLVEAADRAMYRAKAGGGNRWCAHDGAIGRAIGQGGPADALRHLRVAVHLAEEQAATLVDLIDDGAADADVLARALLLLRRAGTLLDDTTIATSST